MADNEINIFEICSLTTVCSLSKHLISRFDFISNITKEFFKTELIFENWLKLQGIQTLSERSKFLLAKNSNNDSQKIEHIYNHWWSAIHFGTTGSFINYVNS